MLRQNRLFVRNVQSFSGSNQRSTFHRSHEAASAPTESDPMYGPAVRRKRFSSTRWCGRSQKAASRA